MTATSFHASGKVILLGEHAVVYGCPALAGALPEGAKVVITPGTGWLHVPAWQTSFAPAGEPSNPDGRPVAHAYRALRRELGAGDTSPVDFTLHFGVPTGAGLGSSAAMGVALARALAAVHGCASDSARLARAAAASETVIHGRPSGLDQAFAETGVGFGLFRRGDGVQPLRAEVALDLCIGHTGKPRDTKGRVSRVAELVEEDPRTTKQRFDRITSLVESAQAAVECGDRPALGQAMNANQVELAALEVSCPEIERMCQLALQAGALGAKLTGGGGGGCVIALASGREAAAGVVAAWEAAGFTSFSTVLGAPARRRSGETEAVA
jgi:mevalonate kinase